jgi:replicative DNA helicase
MTHVSYDDTPPPPPDPHDGGYGNVTPLRPHANTHAEAALISVILTEPDRAPHLLELVHPEEFYEPRHEAFWAAAQAVLAQGLLPDHATLSEQLAKTGDRHKIDFTTYTTAGQTPPSAAQADWHAETVRTHAIGRHATTSLNRATLQLQAATDPTTLSEALAGASDTIDHAVRTLHNAGTTNTIHVPTIGDLLAEADDEYDWVIPGLLEHQERVILTAAEGAGKSTLLRQIAICAAAGTHPFTGETITPQRVLHVDVENSRRQSKRQYRPLHTQAGATFDDDLLRIEIRVQGIDLTTTEDRTWLANTVRSVAPDLIVIGPIYKLANGDPTEEASSKPVAMALDQIRADSDAAIILEAHSAKANGMSKKRPHEPYGWSGWMRWPEIGIFLDDDGKLTHWRGAREERSWPTELKRGGTWPWTAIPSDADRIWEQVRTARLKAGQPIGLRGLEETLSISRSALQRVIGNGGAYGHIWPSYNRNIHPGEERR